MYSHTAMSFRAYDRAIDTKEGQAPYDQPFNLSMYPGIRDPGRRGYTLSFMH